MNLKALIGSGDRIMLLTSPFLVAGLVLNILHPSFFSAGGPPAPWRAISIILLIPGVVIWLWSVILILTKVPRRELITSGPYSLARHPLYTAVALLVLPWLGLLLDSWLGVPIGIILYTASRKFSPAEERTLSETFGAAWDDYSKRVMLPWL